MKKFILASLLLSVLAFSFGCKKDKDEEVKPGVSFRIDGTAWTSTTVLAQHSGGITQIAATNADGTLQLVFEGGNTGTFTMSTGTTMMIYQAGFTMYSADEEMDPAGNINITKYDASTHTIDGTFSFKGYTSEGNFVNITEGKITNVTYMEQ